MVQKLIHEVVTGSLQDHPKLPCNNKEPDERHQSTNAEIEPAGEFLARSCSADHANGTQSTSISLKDSEQKVLSASGGMLNTGMVSMVVVQNQQESGVCYKLMTSCSSVLE